MASSTLLSRDSIKFLRVGPPTRRLQTYRPPASRSVDGCSKGLSKRSNPAACRQVSSVFLNQAGFSTKRTTYPLADRSRTLSQVSPAPSLSRTIC